MHSRTRPLVRFVTSIALLLQNAVGALWRIEKFFSEQVFNLPLFIDSSTPAILPFVLLCVPEFPLDQKREDQALVASNDDRLASVHVRRS